MMEGSVGFVASFVIRDGQAGFKSRKLNTSTSTYVKEITYLWRICFQGTFLRQLLNVKVKVKAAICKRVNSLFCCQNTCDVKGTR